jgi:hypothetical protein
MLCGLFKCFNLNQSGEMKMRSNELKPGSSAQGVSKKTVSKSAGKKTEPSMNKEQLAVLQRIYSMMENIPINVMFADREFALQYINPAALKTFKQLEHLLPIPPERMIGQKIDIFHKIAAIHL